jgi:hypothetical protein
MAPHIPNFPDDYEFVGTSIAYSTNQQYSNQVWGHWKLKGSIGTKGTVSTGRLLNQLSYNAKIRKTYRW